MFKILKFYKNYNKTKHRILNIICLVTLLWAIAYTSFEYFVPLLLENWGYNFVQIGIILSIPSIAALLFDLFIGYLQNKFEKKFLFVISLTLFLLATTLLYFFGSIFMAAIFVMFIYGISFDFFDITAYSSIFKYSNYNTSSSNLSLRDMFEGMGIIIGGILIGFIFSQNENAPFLVFPLFILLSIVIICKYYKEKKSKERSSTFLQKVINIFKDFKSLLNKRIIFILFLVFVITFWDGLFFGFESLFATKFINPYINENVFAGLLLGVYVLPIILFEHPLGVIEDKFGKKNFIFLGLTVMLLGIVLIAISDNIFLLFFAVFLTSLGTFSILWPAATGFYEDLSTKKIGRNNSGESVGAMEFFENFGYIFGPLIGGYFVFNFGFRNTFLVMALFIFIVIILSLIFLRKNRY